MKTTSTHSILQQWQDNTTQMRNLLEQQERIIADLISKHNALQASMQTGNAFFVKDDYPRIVIEIEAHKHIGQTWPCKWSSMAMLADTLTSIVGWLVSPNSLWYALPKTTRYKEEIRRRALSLSK